MGERENQVDVTRDCRKYALHAEVIGKVPGTGRLVVMDGDGVEVDIPLALLIDEVPLRYPEVVAPPAADAIEIETGDISIDAAFRKLMGSPNLGSRRSVFRTYDHQVHNNTVVLPAGDAAPLRSNGTRRAIAISTD